MLPSATGRSACFCTGAARTTRVSSRSPGGSRIATPSRFPTSAATAAACCTGPNQHTWAQYADDVVSLLDHLGAGQAIVGGTGLGATITLRACVQHPSRIRATILISVEDIEGDAKQAEIEFMDAVAEGSAPRASRRPGYRSGPPSRP
ncbi:alpha/beta fold hydrolase [Amycolatopsis roodepoortensis]|uniref:alpha/beta fold hydrolase n=1 Tax=Amycolatopsis roodepoortensis TaxID=700274 RepID=UPI0035317927